MKTRIPEAETDRVGRGKVKQGLDRANDLGKPPDGDGTRWGFIIEPNQTTAGEKTGVGQQKGGPFAFISSAYLVVICVRHGSHSPGLRLLTYASAVGLEGGTTEQWG